MSRHTVGNEMSHLCYVHIARASEGMRNWEQEDHVPIRFVQKRIVTCTIFTGGNTVSWFFFRYTRHKCICQRCCATWGKLQLESFNLSCPSWYTIIVAGTISGWISKPKMNISPESVPGWANFEYPVNLHIVGTNSAFRFYVIQCRIFIFVLSCKRVYVCRAPVIKV